MPKVTMEFNLPDEQSEFELAQNAGKMHSSLWDMYQFLRADSKHGEGKYQEVYDKFWEVLKENVVELFD